jgi:hypothetical protein
LNRFSQRKELVKARVWGFLWSPASSLDTEGSSGSRVGSPSARLSSSYLPRVGAERALEAQELAPAPRGTERILFVDDEEAIAKLGARMLQDLGYVVTSRTSSVEALRLFFENAELV